MQWARELALFLVVETQTCLSHAYVESTLFPIQWAHQSP